MPRRCRPSAEPTIAVVPAMDCFVVSLLHKELSSSGLTGRSSTPRPLDLFSGVSGILDHLLSRVMTTSFADTAPRPTKQKVPATDDGCNGILPHPSSIPKRLADCSSAMIFSPNTSSGLPL